jgi:lipoprotein-anchoring transpeptidase ErfK/SrfK
MSSQSDGSFLYVNDGGGTTWTMPVGIGDGGLGWNDIVYTTNKVAWVVYAPAATFFSQGVLYVTRDAGLTWDPAPFRSSIPGARPTG